MTGLISDADSKVLLGRAVAPRAARFLTGFAVISFLLLSVSYARSKKPWLDEGLQASAAYSLIAHGRFAIPQLEESGMTIATRIPQINRYCYIFGPIYLVAAAGWQKLFGYGLAQIRSFSIVWGLLAMWAWFVIVERLTFEKYAAALAVLLLAFNYQFVTQAANGRFDMMCAALGSIALAIFLKVRERSLEKAIFFSSLAAAAAFFTHPMGLLYALALMWTILVLDSRKLRIIDTACFAAPWLAFAAGVALWIWPHEDIAVAQFAAHTHSRWAGLARPFNAFVTDATQRYLLFFWPTEGGIAGAKALILAVHVAFIAAALTSISIRRSTAFRVLGPSFLTVYCGVALLDSLKFPYYMLHSFVFASAIVAITAARFFFTRMRWVAISAVAALLLVEAGGITAKVREDSYGRQFVPTIAYIRSHTSPGDYVEGEISLNFGLGYSDPGFHMDNRMGYYTGIRPALIVTGEFADFDYFRVHEPDVYRFIRKRLDAEYRNVARFGDYRVYAPR